MSSSAARTVASALTPYVRPPSGGGGGRRADRRRRGRAGTASEQEAADTTRHPQGCSLAPASEARAPHPSAFVGIGVGADAGGVAATGFHGHGDTAQILFILQFRTASGQPEPNAVMPPGGLLASGRWSKREHWRPATTAQWQRMLRAGRAAADAKQTGRPAAEGPRHHRGRGFPQAPALAWSVGRAPRSSSRAPALPIAHDRLFFPLRLALSAPALRTEARCDGESTIVIARSRLSGLACRLPDDSVDGLFPSLSRVQGGIC